MFIRYILLTIFIISFAYGLNDENNLNLIAPKKLNQLEGEIGSLKPVKKSYISETPSLNTLKIKDTNQNSNLDNKLYTKVKLIDVVLETLSRSDNLKSSRESVIQYELKVKNAIADYYPTIDFSYELGRTKTKPDGSGNNHFRFYTDDNFEFILRQNLYAGGATNNNIKSVAKKLEVARNQYRITLDEEIKKAVKAYFDVVFANRSVKVNERNMKKLNKILKIVTTKYDNGAASIGDLTSIKASVANAMTKLVKIKSKFIESLRYYEYIAGIDFEKTLPYEMNFDISLKEFDILYEHALDKNRNLLNYYESIESEKYEQKKRRGAFKPKLDLELTYGEIYDGDGINKTQTDISGKVKLTYNLFNGGKDKNKVLESNSKIRDLNYKLEEEKKKIKWNLSKIHTSMESIDEALKSTIEEIKASRKMVSAYWEAFKLGEQDLQTLLQGQRQLNSAETELVGFEKSQIINFFNTLELTGELASFFNVDPTNPKFIDFSKSDYKKTVIAKDGQKISLELDDKTKDKKEKQKEIEKPIIPLEQKISNFIKKFKTLDDNSFAIEIGDFDSIYDAFDFITKNKLDENSFTFEVIDNYTIKTKIVHNSFKTKEEANSYIKLLEEKKLGKEYKVKEVKELKELYNSYIKGLEIKVPEPEVQIKTKVKIVEKLIEAPVEKEFAPNPEFMNRFLSSNDDFYTINISSFTNLKNLEKFVIKNELKDESFFFRYGNGGELIKLVYGIYENYINIEEKINKLVLENENIFPVVEKVGSVKELYNNNLEFNKKEEDEKKKEQKISAKKDIKNDEEVLTLTKRYDLDEIEKEKKEKVQEIKEELEKILEENNLETKKQEDNKLDEKIVEDSIENSNKQIEDNVVENKEDTGLNKSFKEMFLNAPKDFYTLNLASFPNIELAKDFISNNNLEENTLLATANNGMIKVLNGLYNTKDDAKKAIASFSSSIQNNNPYLQKVFRVKELLIDNDLNNKNEQIKIENKAIDEVEKLEKEKLVKIEAEKKAKEEAERLAKIEAEKKAKEEAERLAKLEAEKLEKERLAKIEAEKKAKEEAKSLEKERLEAQRKAAEEVERLRNERLAKLESERKAKEEAERLAKLEAEKLEKERLAKLEAEKKAKEEAERLAKLEAEKKAKEEAEKLAKLEAQRLAKLEAEKLEKERLAKIEAEKKAKEEAEKLAKLEVEKKAKEEAERLAKLEAEKKAKEEAKSLEKERLEAQRKAAEEVERLRKERLAKLEAEKFAIEEAKRKSEEKAKKLEEERLAKLEAKRKVQEEVERLKKLRIEKLKAEKLAIEEAQRKAKEEAEKLEKERLAKLEAEKKAKKEAEKLEKERLEVQKKAKLEAEKKAKEEAERLAKLEAEKKAKEIEQLKKQKLNMEQKTNTELNTLKEEKKSFENTNKNGSEDLNNKLNLSSKPIEEIDFGSNGNEEVKKVLPYKVRLEQFRKTFETSSKDKYTLKIITLKDSEVNWYVNARGLSPKYVIEGKKRVTIYYGLYDSIDEAKKDIVNLHPLIYESNPPVVKIGSVR